MDSTEIDVLADVPQEAKPEEKQEKRWRKAWWRKKIREWLAFLQHYAPYALLLLLAPQVERHIVFYSGGEALFPLPYWLILGAVAVPLGLAYLWLRPAGEHPVFRFAALLLPMQFYFMLLFSARTSPVIALGLIAACVVFGIACRIWLLRKVARTPAENYPFHEDSDECQKLNKPHRCRVLRYTVTFASALLLVFSVMGALPEREAADPGLFTAEGAFLPAQPVDRLQLLSPAHWGGLTARERREVLQTLLNAETRALNMAPMRLDDEAIFELQGSGGMSIRRALRSGRNQMEGRVRAVSYAAYYHRLAQNDAIDPADFDERAGDYADRRVAHYAALLEAGRHQEEED